MVMKVAVIGTGNVGRALAGGMVRARHDVTVTSRGESARILASEIGATAVSSARQAAAAADVIVLSIPFDAARDVSEQIAPVSAGKVIVDVTNAAKPDWSGPLFEGSSSEPRRPGRR